MKIRAKTNQYIRATELRVITEDGDTLGVLSLKDALAAAQARGLDLIETGPNAVPPIAKIMEYGKYLYLENKKEKKMKAGAKRTETKAIQIKVATGEHDLELKAKQASKWLAEGHRIKVELYLSGRTKYQEEKFLKERLDRVLRFITEPYKVAEEPKRGPKGLALVIERAAPAK
ncbi:MAG: translation initiation factor IF-3 [Candidatus Pacebacteria bacterium]|nr:translation initiation factor IF-3 [Candidatus Paceibacterota bacterium]